MRTIIFYSTYCLSAVLLLSSCATDTGRYTSESPDAFYGGSIIEGMPNTEKYKDYEENPFILTSEQPVSTFSIDADGGSYSNMRRFATLGQVPPKASVRIEEFINYFTFNYPEPTGQENIALNSETAVCPWNEEHYLLRIGIKGKTIPENEIPDANFVFLIDVSGSMASADKLELLKTGFKQMIDEMRPTDRVAIVTYAGQAAVLLESTFCDEKSRIKAAIDKLGAGGSTAGAEGIVTAYKIAEKNFLPQGNNRIILGSDGDFNVGVSSTEELVKLIEEKRDKGIFLTVLGVGAGNLNDHMMEQIANKGDGNYEYIDNVKQLKKVFIYEKSKFYTVAKDSKIQITFNPDIVISYRLIGYENRALNNEDFEKDSVDAGEIGASQTITAVYELDLANSQQGETIANFDFRYKKPNETESRLLNHAIQLSAASSISQSGENMRFASAITCFGLLMKQSQYKGQASKAMALELGKNAVIFDPNGFRKEFLELVEDIDF
jgi:Ca-activated chloride channel family protein